MSREDFQQNNEHGGYPITVERDNRPPWFYPLCAFLFIAWNALVAYGAHDAGYRKATAKAEADQQYVNDQMDKLGFCEWVKQVEFAQYCSAKVKP